MTWRLLIFLLIFFWEHWTMHPSLPSIPHEILESARAISATATKWGLVADALLSWHLPAAFIAGAVVCFVLVKLWSPKK